MKKQICSLLLALLMMVTMFPVCQASATTIIGRGNCGAADSAVTWQLDSDGVMLITGQGAMQDYEVLTSPWAMYGSLIKELHVISGVTSIGDYAFYQCPNLKTIWMNPGDVERIGDSAFSSCAALEEIEIRDSVTSIGDNAFYGCTGLKSATIGSGVKIFGDYAFWGCTGLTEIIYNAKAADPLSVSPFNSPFQYCGTLEQGIRLTIGDGVESVPNYIFSGCSNLTSVTIPISVTSIGTKSFDNCPALTDVYFGGSQSQWNAIDIAADGNDALRNATIYFAQPDPQPPVEPSGTIAVSSVRARAGQAVTVKVDLSANKGISNMRLQMSYPEGFTLKSIQKGDALSTLFFTPPGKLTANPVNFVWDGTEADMSEGCILELTFRIADTVAVGEYSISLSYQKDDVLDGSLEGIDLALQNGTVSVVEFTRGDIDDDGVIGMKDLGALRKYFAGGYDAGNFVMEAADLDGDGVVTMKDLGVLRRYLAGGYDINLGK